MTSESRFAGERVSFVAAFKDASRGVRRIKQAEYLPFGAHPVVDQGKGFVAGYSNEESGLFADVPAIVFGDHTRIVKYVDEPFFAGADGVKILKPNLSSNVRYWYHALRATGLEDLGYSRHFKLLREKTFSNPSKEEQESICSSLDGVLRHVELCKKQLDLLDQLVKSQFVEMFGESSGEEMIALKDCCVSIRGGKTPSMKHPEYYGGTVPFIKSGDVKGDAVSFGSLWLSDTALERAGVKLVPKGSLLVVTRSALLQRKVCSAICDIDVAINQDIKAFVPKRGFSASYLLWAVRSYEQRLLAGVRSVSTSALDLNDLCSLPIMKATEAKQQEFADFVAQVNKSEFAVRQQIEKLQTLYDSLAQEYFG